MRSEQVPVLLVVGGGGAGADRFAVAAFDGAFVASRTDRALGLEALLRPLAPGLVAARRSLIANG